jgi:type IV pilus assembly protein PilQ
MLTLEQVFARARKQCLAVLLGGALVSAAPVWAQIANAENHASPKAMTPVSMPSMADRVEIGKPSDEPDDNQQKKPAAPPQRGNRDTQTQQGKSYGDADFVGEPINLNVVDADIRDVLNYITEQYGVNFVIDATVASAPPKISVNLNGVPWNVALKAILSANGLGIDVNGPILRVAKSDVLAKEAGAKRSDEQRILDSKPLFTEVIRLNYARAGKSLDAAISTAVYQGRDTSDGSTTAARGGTQRNSEGGILPIIQRRLSPRGSIEVEERSNTLIVTDIRESLEAVKQLVALLDRPEPQVEIEARIVVANRSFSRDLGIQLGALAIGPNGRGASGGTIGGNNGNSTLINPLGSPGPIGGSTANTILALTTGAIGTAQISVFLNAAEQKGQAKIIASPRVTAMNAKRAEILSGSQIPVVTPQAVQGGGVILTTEFKPVPLSLTVVPQITDAGTIILDLEARNDSVNRSVQGVTQIDTNVTKSTVLVPDGGTTVIGGVVSDAESESQNRTPGVSSIPLVGNLFKRKNVSRQTNEILFFITPRIYRPDYQGNPMPDAPKATGTRSNTIFQPVPLGNPATNTPVNPGSEGSKPAEDKKPAGEPIKPKDN